MVFELCYYVIDYIDEKVVKTRYAICHSESMVQVVQEKAKQERDGIGRFYQLQIEERNEPTIRLSAAR